MELRVDYFLEAMPAIAAGWLGVFVVTGVIIGAVMVLERLTRDKQATG